MGYEARVILDSISNRGHRLTTMIVTFPRFILAEFNTHRVFSRNSASSRAIPLAKQIERVLDDPFVPASFDANKSGMQAGKPLTKEQQVEARAYWLLARDDAAYQAHKLGSLGVHKQWASRLLEPFTWHTVIVTATEWHNFFALRDSPLAQPEMQTIARMMREAYQASTPTKLEFGEWHMPLLPDAEELPSLLNEGRFGDGMQLISAARCARVSYLTHEGKRDIAADLALAERLIKDGHMSPFEHVATPGSQDDTSSNFVGWFQYRKTLPNEACYVPTV